MTTMESLLCRPRSLFIEGDWSSAPAGEILNVVNPSTEEAFASIRAGSTADVDRAVRAAQYAFKGWRAVSCHQRALYLRAFANGLERSRSSLVGLQMRNNGKPRTEAELDVSDAIATFAYYAELIEGQDENRELAVPLPDPAFKGYGRREPLGPVGMIVPWNFPLVTSAWKIAPALAAGCTVVLKTSEFTPFIELFYADLAAEMSLPAGVLNILTGAAEVGQAMAAHKGLRKLSFTGSNRVGTHVMQAAAAGPIPVTLELGGKSAILVFADADPDIAVELIMSGIFFNCGQMCSATSRLLLDQRIADVVLDGLLKKLDTLCVDSPELTDPQMGPLTTRPQYKKVSELLRSISKDGTLHCLAGGRPMERPGFFIEPTVFMDVPVEHVIWNQEIFGPVLAVRRFQSTEEAVTLANHSDYGLVATIVTADMERARRVAAQLDVGHVWINAPQVIFPNTSWGGFKASGIGRELGPIGLEAYREAKHITYASS